MDAAQDGERIMTEADVILLRTTVASLDAYRPGICSRTKEPKRPGQPRVGPSARE